MYLFKIRFQGFYYDLANSKSIESSADVLEQNQVAIVDCFQCLIQLQVRHQSLQLSLLKVLQSQQSLHSKIQGCFLLHFQAPTDDFCMTTNHPYLHQIYASHHHLHQETWTHRSLMIHLTCFPLSCLHLHYLCLPSFFSSFLFCPLPQECYRKATTCLQIYEQRNDADLVY